MPFTCPWLYTFNTYKDDGGILAGNTGARVRYVIRPRRTTGMARMYVVRAALSARKPEYNEDLQQQNCTARAQLAQCDGSFARAVRWGILGREIAYLALLDLQPGRRTDGARNGFLSEF